MQHHTAEANLQVGDEASQLQTVLLLSKQQRDVPQIAANGAHILPHPDIFQVFVEKRKADSPLFSPRYQSFNS